ncbi:MAG: alpha-hydroxy acid oxidase [Mangrovicoccus sp.]
MSLPLRDFEALAEAAMEPSAFAYVAGAAGQELTARRNLEAWAELPLRPKSMRDLSGLTTACDLLGLRLDAPLLVAPMAYQRLATPEGERAMALAAAAQGVGFVLSCQSSVAPEEAAVAPFWFQLYLQRDPAHSRALAARALAAGATALVVTVDAPVNGIRDREIKAGFSLPQDVRPVMLDALGIPAAQGTLEELLSAAPDWQDLAALCAESPVPVIAKGVMTAEDAQAALAAGCAAVILSNHGGRVLDGLPATAEVLPQIRAALPEAVLLVDGGIRTGQDMLRALALGADAVLLGRPAYFALAAGGAQGASACLRRLRDEFTIAMALCGARHPGEIGPDCLYTSA